MSMNAFLTRPSLWTSMLAAAVLIGGCSEGNDKPARTRRLEGIARKIDLQNKVVSMVVKRDDGKEDELTGTFRDTTEVFINGRQEKVDDVREGDKVVAFVQKDKSGDQGKYVVTRVEVERPEADKTVSTPPKEPEVPNPAVPVNSGDQAMNTEPVKTPPPAPMETSDDDKRSSTEDLIYGQIRLKMEEAIADRAKKLKEGADPGSTEIQKLEYTILKARELLAERGEVLEDVEPPIVRPTSPTTQPAP